MLVLLFCFAFAQELFDASVQQFCDSGAVDLQTLTESREVEI